MPNRKPVRFSLHARQSLRDREVAQEEIEQTLQNPEFVISGYAGREVYLRRYQDGVLKQEMLLRVIVEDTENERVVVTVH